MEMGVNRFTWLSVFGLDWRYRRACDCDLYLSCEITIIQMNHHQHISVKEKQGICHVQTSFPARNGETRIGIHKINKHGTVITCLSVELDDEQLNEIIKILSQIAIEKAR